MRGSRAARIFATLGLGAAGVAHADRLTETPTIARRPSAGAQVTRKLTLMGDELGLHLSTLTGDLVRLKFDFARQQGRFRLGGGQDEGLLFRLDGDVEVHGAVARVRTRVDLGLGGQRITLDLPDVDLVTETVAGERAFELRLPVFEGRF